MIFTKQGNFKKKPSDLPDIPSPSFTPSEIREYWQTPHDELKTTVNKVVDDLNSDRWVDKDKIALQGVERENIKKGAVGTNELDPQILAQPTSAIGVQAKFQAVDEQLAQIAINVTSQSDLEYAISLNKKVTCNIGKNVDIIGNITIPQSIILKFNNGGKLNIKSGVTLTLNGQIEAGYYQIFDFENDTSILTTDNVKFGQELNSPKVGYVLHPDWFGAIPDAYPAKSYNYNNDAPFGTDSTLAFKRCMSFAEAASPKYNLDPNRVQPRVLISFRPNSTYLIKGDNPLGVQSTTPNVGYFIQIRGNGATILWEPLSISDVLFKKYGRIVNPLMKDFNVLLIGKQGQRWGKFLSTKTGEGDQNHFWTRGIFKNLMLNSSYSAVGYDTVFDIDIDGSHSHDDLTILENVYAPCYKTFLKLNNKEAVNWKLEKIFFDSMTDNASHIEIIDGFSGGLTLESCDILIRQTGEVFLKAGDDVSSTPIRIQNGRMETRGSLPFTFIDAKSGNIIVNNVQFPAGNGGSSPHTNTRTAKVGEKAYIRFEDCGLYDQFEVNVSTIGGQKNTALEFKQCSFTAYIRNAIRTLGYPKINFINNGLPITLAQVIKSSLYLRKIIVNNPGITDGSLLLPIEYGTRGANLTHYKAEIFKLKPDGNPTLNLAGINSIPPYSVITDIKLFASSIDTSKVDGISFQFYEDEASPGSNATTLDYMFPSNTEINGVSILGNQIITLPQRVYMSIFPKKNGVTVSDISLMPIAWVEISYKAISKRTDFLPNDTQIGRKAPLATY